MMLPFTKKNFLRRNLEVLSTWQWEAFCQLQNWKKKSTAFSLEVRDGATIHLGPRAHTSGKAWGGSAAPSEEAGAPSWEVCEVQWHCCHCGLHSVWEEVRQGACCAYWTVETLGSESGFWMWWWVGMLTMLCLPGLDSLSLPNLV